MAMRIRRKIWDNQTALQARKTFQLFAEICSNRPIGGYVRDDAVKFKNVLSDLPADYARAPRHRGLTPREIINAVRGEAVDLLSSRTVQRHISALSSLWGDAVERGVARTNIFRSFRFAAAKRAKDQRSEWKAEQLAALFATPAWRGCKSAKRRNETGTSLFTTSASGFR